MAILFVVTSSQGSTKTWWEWREGTMTEESFSPNEKILKVAEEGIRGMINALGAETIAPDVMIDAALHILAAWVASSQTKSTAAEWEAVFGGRGDFLPSFIDYHRGVNWLPDPHRTNN